MRVLLLADSLDNGGLERQLCLLAANLPSAWKPRVWAMGGGPFETYLRERGVPLVVHERRARFDPSPIVRLWRDVNAWRPDVVHAWGWMSALAAVPVCRLLRIPLVDGMIRSGDVERDNTLLKRLGMHGADIVVANTRAGLLSWNISASKGRVIQNGFDPSRIPPRAQGDNQGAGPFTVVMTGRMAPVKDFDLVLEVARRLSAVDDGWRFELVGDGPDRGRLLSGARELVNRGIVGFPPPGAEVLDVVRGADAGILMTNPRYAHEGLSNSVMEYMALGLPVVCGDGGGNPELVDDRVTGFIIPQSDPGRLAQRLTYLRAHPDEAKEMGAAGRDKVLSDLSIPSMVEATLSCYSEAVALTKERCLARHSPKRTGSASSRPWS